MADSGERSADYARRAGSKANAANTTRSVLRFRPRWWSTLLVLLLVPLFISFGQWQWNKASVKEDRQALRDTRNGEPAVHMPSTPADPESLRYRRVVARGSYEPEFQILVDNRIYREQAGYHVITPLRLEGSEMRVLVNRGWVPALADHSRWPRVATPADVVEVSGMATVPGTRYLMLGPDSPSADGSGWQVVWQNLDLPRYQKVSKLSLQPVVIELAADSPSGGFAREWPRPDERIDRHIGYAFQWWGFAGATLIIWVVVNLRRQP